MIIGIAGRVSSPDPAERRANIEALNRVAALVLLKGHIPLVGVNAARPVVEAAAGLENPYEPIMAISLAVINACEGLLLLGESPGANRERDLILSKGMPVL